MRSHPQHHIQASAVVSILSSSRIVGCRACDSVCTSTSVVSASVSWDADSSMRLESHSVDSASVRDATSNSCAAKIPAPSAALACPHAASSLPTPKASCDAALGWQKGRTHDQHARSQGFEINEHSAIPHSLLENVVQRACERGGHLRTWPVGVHAQGLQHARHNAKFPKLRCVFLRATSCA
jgi:hypothetical protein